MTKLDERINLSTVQLPQPNICTLLLMWFASAFVGVVAVVVVVLVVVVVCNSNLLCHLFNICNFKLGARFRLRNELVFGSRGWNLRTWTIILRKCICRTFFSSSSLHCVTVTDYFIHVHILLYMTTRNFKLSCCKSTTNKNMQINDKQNEIKCVIWMQL